jgi:hypothetical protein
MMVISRTDKSMVTVFTSLKTEPDTREDILTVTETVSVSSIILTTLLRIREKCKADFPMEKDQFTEERKRSRLNGLRDLMPLNYD